MEKTEKKDGEIRYYKKRKSDISKEPILYKTEQYANGIQIGVVREYDKDGDIINQYCYNLSNKFDKNKQFFNQDLRDFQKGFYTKNNYETELIEVEKMKRKGFISSYSYYTEEKLRVFSSKDRCECMYINIKKRIEDKQPYNISPFYVIKGGETRGAEKRCRCDWGKSLFIG